MIETEFNQRKKYHVVLGFFVACLLFSFSLSAQSSYPPLVSESQAQTMLNAEIPVLEAALDNLSSGSAAYRRALRTYSLYVHTWEGLDTGLALENALTLAYDEFATSPNGGDLSADELPVLSKDGIDYGDTAFAGLVNFLSL